MSITDLAATWIEQHKDEIEDHGEDYSWIPGECAAYNTLEEVMEAFGEAGVEPFNLYQGYPIGFYNYIWHSYRGTGYAIWVPRPSIRSETNFLVNCQTNARIARALGLEVFKYKGKIDPQSDLCPYIIVSPNQIQQFKNSYLEGYKGFVYSIKASDYELVREESEI